MESLVSGYAIEKIYKKPAKDLTEEEWEEVGLNLGKGLRNVTIMYAPEVILLGGGVAINAHPKMLETSFKFLKGNVKLVKIPEIRISKFRHNAPLMGSIAAAILYSKKEVNI